MNLFKLYRVLVLGSSVLVATACGVDPVGRSAGSTGGPGGKSPMDPAQEQADAGQDTDAGPDLDAGLAGATDAGDDAGPVILADAGSVDAGDAGGVPSWVSWI